MYKVFEVGFNVTDIFTNEHLNDYLRRNCDYFVDIFQHVKIKNCSKRIKAAKSKVRVEINRFYWSVYMPGNERITLNDSRRLLNEMIKQIVGGVFMNFTRHNILGVPMIDENDDADINSDYQIDKLLIVPNIESINEFDYVPKKENDFLFPNIDLENEEDLIFDEKKKELTNIILEASDKYFTSPGINEVQAGILANVLISKGLIKF